MAYTNAELTRLLVGDTGLWARDQTSGDGSGREFFLSTPPLIGDSQQVELAGSLKTEGVDYSLNDESGRLLFTAPPPAGTGNVVVIYRACQITDAEVEEALRQHGLLPSVQAEQGEPPGVLGAALLLAEMMANRYASTGNISLGGGGALGTGSLSDQWGRRADYLSKKLADRQGITSVPVQRQDGYSQDVTAIDVRTSGQQNPRRYYYGEEDRIP